LLLSVLEYCCNSLTTSAQNAALFINRAAFCADVVKELQQYSSTLSSKVCKFSQDVVDFDIIIWQCSTSVKLCFMQFFTN